MSADATPFCPGNSLDIVRPEDLSSEESKKQKRQLSDSSGRYEHNYDSFLFIFSFIFAFSCFLDIFFNVQEAKQNGYNSITFILRTINDALCIFPWFIYMKHINYEGQATKNIIIGIFIAAPQLIISILSAILIFANQKNNDDNSPKKDENLKENYFWQIFISNIVNLVLYILFTLIMLLRLQKIY